MLADQERYVRGFEHCSAKSNSMLPFEIRMLWGQIANSYLFLLKREARLAAEARESCLNDIRP